MSLSQSLQQKLLQKLSPQQIQLMKLLQIPTANLEERIKEELEENPALEFELENNNSDQDNYELDGSASDGADGDEEAAFWSGLTFGHPEKEQELIEQFKKYKFYYI